MNITTLLKYAIKTKPAIEYTGSVLKRTLKARKSSNKEVKKTSDNLEDVKVILQEQQRINIELEQQIDTLHSTLYNLEMTINNLKIILIISLSTIIVLIAAIKFL